MPTQGKVYYTSTISFLQYSYLGKKKELEVNTEGIEYEKETGHLGLHFSNKNSKATNTIEKINASDQIFNGYQYYITNWERTI